MARQPSFISQSTEDHDLALAPDEISQRKTRKTMAIGNGKGKGSQKAMEMAIKGRQWQWQWQWLSDRQTAQEKKKRCFAQTSASSQSSLLWSR
jgi:hypothetical protein